MIRFTMLLACAAALSGCASGTIATRSLNYAAEQELRDAAATEDSRVILRRERRSILHWSPQSSWTKWQSHEATVVFPSQDGASNLELKLPGDARVLTFRARAVLPEGTRVLASTPDDARVVVDDGDRVLLFPFPEGLPDGTVIEAVVTLKTDDSIDSQFNQYLDSKRRVRWQRDTVIAHRTLKGALRVFNTKARPTAERVGDYNVYSIELTDTPANKNETWDAPARQRRPWWAYRVKQLKARRTYDWKKTWGQVMRRFSEQMYDTRANATVEFAAPECEGQARCIAQAALERLNRETEVTARPGRLTYQNLKKVRRSGEANPVGRAVYYRELLVAAGLTRARFAAVGRNVPRPVEAFPVANWFNHVLVFVPGDTPLWVDPSCQWCRAGQLPSSVYSARALLVEPPSAREDDQEARWVDVSGDRVGENLRVETAHYAWVDESISATHRETLHGPAAEGEAIAHHGWEEDDWNAWAGTKLGRKAKIVDVEAACDVGKPVCETTIVAGIAPKGDVVPLPYRPPLSFWARKAKGRRWAVVIPETFRGRGTLTVTVPNGFVADAPASHKETAGLLSWSRHTRLMESKLTIEWEIEIREGRVEPEDFLAFRASMKRYQGGRMRLVAEKNEAFLRREPAPPPVAAERDVGARSASVPLLPAGPLAGL
jgi:hypothetical protein